MIDVASYLIGLLDGAGVRSFSLFASVPERECSSFFRTSRDAKKGIKM